MFYTGVMAASTNFALVVWKGKDPSWSIIGCSSLDSPKPTPGGNTYALWGAGKRKKKYQCEILAIAGGLKQNCKSASLTCILMVSAILLQIKRKTWRKIQHSSMRPGKLIVANKHPMW